MDIIIKTIPKSEQRLDDCGDWFFDEAGNLQIRVTDTGNWKYEYLVAQHELVEAVLCKERGVTTQQADDFDNQFSADIKEGKIKDNTRLRAGDDPRCPYKNEHFFAMNLERLMAGELNVDWKPYDDFLETV